MFKRAEEQELRALIHAWHRQYPAQTAFAYMRCSDFAEACQASSWKIEEGRWPVQVR